MNPVLDISEIISILKSIARSSAEPVPLHAPMFSGNEWRYVKDCLDTGWVSSAGKFVGEFENSLVSFTGIEHAIATVNGTSALHICLMLAGITEGDEVLMPALTFVATANAVKYCGAVPHFVDNETTSLGVDAQKLENYLNEISEINDDLCLNKNTKRHIKALVVMHTFGHPCDLDRLWEVCERHRLILIEDCAEALGSYYKNTHVGRHGILSALSFNGNKIVTAGGGGAVLTKDRALAEKARHLSTTAKIPHAWVFEHDEIGYNYRLPNINAALGLAQMEQLENFIIRKRALAEKYRKAFSHMSGITFFQEPQYAKSNYWLNTLLLDEEYSMLRDFILSQLNGFGIGVRPSWKLMNKLAMFRSCPHMDLSVSESLERRIINIPSSACLY